jgi:hypothetical protein
MLPLTSLQEHAHQRAVAAQTAAAHHRMRRALTEERRRRDDDLRLLALLDLAALAPLEDLATWRTVRDRAARLTARLVEEERLPRHLVVDADDVPVVVARTVAAAWRHVVRTSSGAGGVMPRPDR